MTGDLITNGLGECLQVVADVVEETLQFPQAVEADDQPGVGSEHPRSIGLLLL